MTAPPSGFWSEIVIAIFISLSIYPLSAVTKERRLVNYS